MHVALARYNAQPFDASKLDRVVMVLLDEGSSGFKVDLERGIASMEGHVSVDRVWDFPVPDLNDHMPDHDPTAEGNIRNVMFTFEQLAPSLVWSRSEAAETEQMAYGSTPRVVSTDLPGDDCEHAPQLR
jgi:hypothetical protein